MHEHDHGHEHHHNHDDCCCGHDHEQEHHHHHDENSVGSRLKKALCSAGLTYKSMVLFLLIGVLLSAALESFVPQGIIERALTGAWAEKTVFEAGQGSAAGGAAVSRAELARAMNSLLSRSPDREDAQLRAAAWYWDNQDETAWYYADLIEAAVDHTCRIPAAAEQWTAIG
mgnify:CR=1 FL=1